MSDDCLGKPCILCGRRINGGNWYCPKCKVCVCFYCGITTLLNDHAFPVCQGKLT